MLNTYTRYLHPVSKGDPVVLTTNDCLTISEIVLVARDLESVDLDPSLIETIRSNREKLEKQLSDGKTYYGINSGFGSLATCSLPASQAQQLSRNLITSHSIGVGPSFPPDVVRAAMLIRLKSLSWGHSGVRPQVLETFASALNAKIYPFVPSQGSLGACGDLAPLSHLALAFTRHPGDSDDGAFWHPAHADVFNAHGAPSAELHLTRDYVSNRQRIWRKVSAEQMLGDDRLILESKEGLALNNGATFSAALGALLSHDMMRLLATDAPAALAIALEAVEGVRDSFLSPVVALRPHPGSIKFSERMTSLLQDSKAVSGSLTEDPARIPPQEPYSIRCATAAFGGFWSAHKMLKQAIKIEINSVTDNPLFFPDGAYGVERDYAVLSGGNFHGDPIAIPLDSASLALTKLGSLMERLIFKLTDWPARGLPPFLIGAKEVGLNSGLMIPQYTAASLVNECQTLCHPASANSIPSSANQEDYVSMSMNAAKNATQIRENVEKIIALALFNACQAIDVASHQPRERMATRTRRVYNLIRKTVPPVSSDRVMAQDIDSILVLMRSDQIWKAISDEPQ